MRNQSLTTLLFCCWLAGSAVGQPLSLEQAVQQAVDSHPRVLAAQRRAEAARVRARFSGAPLNPTLRVGETIGDPVEEVNILTQRFELAGQPGLRADLAMAQAQAREYELAATRREIAVEVGRFFMEYWVARARARVFAQRLDIFRQFEHAALRRFQVGEIPRNQHSRVAIETRRAAAEAAEADARVAQAETRLRTSLGLASPVALGVDAGDIPRAPLAAPPAPMSLEQVRQAALAAPEIRQAEANRQAAHFETELARKQGSPELGLSLYRSSFFRDVVEQGVQLTVSWTPWDYGQIAADVAAREGEEQALEAEVETSRRSSAQRVETAYHAWAGAQRRRDLLQDQLAESLRLAQAAQTGFAAGYMSLLDVLDAQRTLRDAQLEYLAAESDLAVAWLELNWYLRSATPLQAPATLPLDTKELKP